MQAYRRDSTGGFWRSAHEQEEVKDEFFRRFGGQGRGQGRGRGQRRVLESDSEEEEEEQEAAGEDHYAMLGVLGGASERDIKIAYRKLALK